jgi:N-acetylmuramoyl-L-alanine amidase
MGTVLRGDGSFPFVATVDGDDLVVEKVICSWFGGLHDPGDDGNTASGVNTKRNPDFQGAALPMDGFHHRATDGSPIPKLPWRTPVQVTNLQNNGKITVPLIDLGPAKTAGSHASLDLTPPAFQALGGNLGEGLIRVSYRVMGVARLVPSFLLPTVSATSSGNGNSQPLLLPSDGHGSSNPKPPIKQFIYTHNYSSRNGATIKVIVLHCAESSLQSAINMFLRSGPNPTSAHYIIDRDGDIYQMVADVNKAWHCMGANTNSIGIEHVGSEQDSLTDQQTASSVALIKWLMKEYGVTPDQIFGHDFTPGYNRPGGTTCPDAVFGRPHQQKTIVNWLTKNGIPQNPPQPGQGNH